MPGSGTEGIPEVRAANRPRLLGPPVERLAAEPATAVGRVVDPVAADEGHRLSRAISARQQIEAGLRGKFQGLVDVDADEEVFTRQA